MNKGRTLKVFLVDGTPTGLLTAEIMNWTGHVITGPRSRLTELIQRPEAQRTAVYFLVGPDQGAGIGTQVYIGETDDAARRLAQHNKPEQPGGGGGKDFWERVCVVTSKDANLTKGHIKYLESRLIATAKEAGRCELLNGTDPGYASLPEADRSDMEYFLEQIQTLLPVLGFDFLRAPPRKPKATATPETGDAARGESPVFIGDVKKYGITARGQEIDGEFVVFKGSKARRTWEGVEVSYTKLFHDLVARGILKPAADGQLNEFGEDYAFSSPSAAAAVVAGRPANGRIHWIVEGGRQTYGEWQAEKVSRITGELQETLGELTLSAQGTVGP
ncbi:MAG: GIY-YIG nuclease family protein [Burkholderiaceae bacterium]|nr:GIY-YIG nuclease family protein [Aquabacterium sp.]NUP85563.1 GIY-YIG nuclease family protein [Burkholderiaceae bacterium]